jgi:peptidoglycan/LPS O-acetylase OafA/YrhL
MRALAVASVVAYHLAPGALPGGFLGVDIFFVISGYLITSLIADEHRRTQAVRLVGFWGRRVRRLYPAVVALLAVLIPVAAVVDHAALAESRTTILMALVYATNWWFVFHHVPYFQRFGPPPLLLHLWSLAIEEQYYLVWPPILAWLLGRSSRQRLAAGTAVAALASAVLMGVLYSGAGSVSRVYYGSDTHAFGLLIGSALALAIPPTGFPARLPVPTRRRLDRAGAAALVVIGLAVVALRESDGFTWRGGMLLADAAAGVAVLVAAHPATRLSTLLARRPLRWLGTRSYSVYLWHWPVIVLTAAGSSLAIGGMPALVVRLVLIGVLAEASYRWVETPWRTRRAQRWLRQRLAGPPRVLWGAGVGVVATLAGLVALASLATVRLPPGERISATPAAAAVLPAGPSQTTPRGEPTALGAAVRLRAGPMGGAGAHRLTGVAGHPAPPAPGPDPTTETTPAAAPSAATIAEARSGGRVLAIGDSVMLAASSDLEQAFGPEITVDASVGRQVYAGLDRLAQYRRAGLLRGLRALVVGLGSNGPFTPYDLAELRQLAAGVPRVVLVNVRVPDPWQAESNATIDGAAHLPGYVVVNWYRTSADRALLYPDGIHPDVAGQEVYAQLVVGAVTGSGAGS